MPLVIGAIICLKMTMSGKWYNRLVRKPQNSAFNLAQIPAATLLKFKRRRQILGAHCAAAAA